MILHVDMDAFYASVEERERPELVGKPLIIGGTPQGRGVVAAANYAAREFGVHSAMSAARAGKLCPHAAFLRPRMKLYMQVSAQIREIFHRYTPLVEPLSLDEAFLDVAGCESLFGPAETIGRRIRDEIAGELRLAASVGVAPNKFLAKIASDLKKPNGFVVVPPDGVQKFLDPLPVGRLWGVGRAGGRVFEKIGIHTIGQLRQLPEELLVDHFGSHGAHLARLSRGIDDRQVVPDRIAKSVSHETTFPENVCDPHVLQAWLLDLTEQVAMRIRRRSLRGRTVHIKLRYADFHTITRATTLPQPTDLTREIWQAAKELLEERLPKRRLEVRLLGVGVSGFESGNTRQLSLFPDESQEAHSQVDQAADKIRERFGNEALLRGSGLIAGRSLRQKPTDPTHDGH
ncbi:DNA polymerase IV [Maioricimonas rarisocia]|uniref:DNA polymerase IV n=1 Tax=Maioricimonas rarisocia TaxID=2528026 RepID=A0A517ZC70_9PLAN|nr:DNA polymerase IV [Maioricimonas rarisocia]QDU40052.1 DNA polymerase IV [Maioricimonas rarisocia]